MADEQLLRRVEAIEKALIALSDATQEWEGGAYESAGYSSARWRDKVRNAVNEIRLARSTP